MGILVSLKETTDKIIGVLGQAHVTTAPIAYTTYQYVKASTSAFTVLTNPKSFNGTTPVDLTDVLAAGYRGDVINLHIVNPDTIPHTFSISLDVSGTSKPLISNLVLQPNESKQFPKIIAESARGVFAYASDNIGTDFSLTPASNLIYIAGISTTKDNAALTVADFSGYWQKYRTGNTFSYSALLSNIDYTLPYNGTLNTATSTNGGTIDAVKLNGVNTALPFDFSSGDKVRISRAIGAIQPVTTIAGVFRDTNTSIISNALDEAVHGAWLVQEMVDYIVYVTWTHYQTSIYFNNTGATIIKLYNKNTGVIKSYIAPGLGVPPRSLSYDATSGYAVLTIYGNTAIYIKEDGSILTTGIAATACTNVMNQQQCVFFNNGATRCIGIPINSTANNYPASFNVYNASTMAYISTLSLSTITNSQIMSMCWDGGDYIYFGMRGDIRKYQISTNTISATITTTSPVIFMNNEAVGGKCWFTQGTYVGYVTTATDAVTLVNTGVTIQASNGYTGNATYGLGSGSELSWMDTVNNLIYCPGIGTTNLVTFDMATNLYTVTDITALTGGLTLHTIRGRHGRPIVSCMAVSGIIMERKLIQL